MSSVFYAKYAQTLWRFIVKTYEERMKELRAEKGKSQAEIGQEIGKSQRGYADYETGKNDTPTKVLRKLADYYEVSTDYLLGRTDKRKPYPPTKED